MLSGSNNTIKEIQRKFGEVAADVQKYKSHGDVVLVLVRDCNPKNWESNNSKYSE